MIFLKIPSKLLLILFEPLLLSRFQKMFKGYSASLVNLGKTCYMNSTMQCLKSVPELKSELSNYQSARTKDVDQTSHMPYCH
ncbi:unnamed protein product [Arabidopsis halleri]